MIFAHGGGGGRLSPRDAHAAAALRRAGFATLLPDLAGDAPPPVRTPTRLVVGGDDTPVIAMNEDARARMSCETALEIAPGATHFFEEPGTLAAAVDHATRRFAAHLRRATDPRAALSPQT